MRKRASSPGAPKPRRRRKLNIFVDIEADEDSETDDVLSDGGDANDELYLPVRSPQVTALPGPSAKDRLAANIDEIFDRYKENAASSPQSLRASHYDPRAAPFSGTIISKTSLQSPAARKMYRLRVQRTALDFIINHLRENGFQVFVSAWVSGNLYVAAESPNTIAESLPPSHALAVREYTCISEEELDAVMRSRSRFPHPAWVRIKRGRYNGGIGYVFDSDQSNGLVGVLIPPRDFRDPTSKGSATLLDRCHLPNDKSLSDILLGEQVVGWSYKGEQYYKGLLLKHFHRECLELVTCPHVDDIRLHLQSGWDLPFLTRTKVAFSMQFLRAGDAVRVIAGELHSLVATVTSVDHICGSASLELTLDGQTTEAQVRLENLERVFHVGDVVRVVAGSYLGLEGYILEMSEEIFDLRQDISGEQVQVSKYYLERHSLDHRFSSALPIQPNYEASLDDDDLQIGDHIKVLSGKHKNKRGVVEWLSVGGSHLWFIKETGIFEDTEFGLEPSGIRVPVEIIQRVRIPDVLKLTMDKGFDVKPGDHVKVARGPHYKATGIVQSVDFPNARLTLKCDAGDALIDVPIRFAAMIVAVSLDMFNDIIGKEVFVIGGDCKGYRGTLLGIGPDLCIVSVPAHPCLTLKQSDVVTQYGMRLNGVMLNGSDMSSFCEMRAGTYIRTFTSHRNMTPPPPPTQTAPSCSSDSITCPVTSQPSSSALNLFTVSHEEIQEGSRNPAESSTGHEHTSFSSDPWTADPQDTHCVINQKVELSWLINKEFSSVLLNWHVVLKVSVRFMGGRLDKRLVSTACPDPFFGENGPVPQGSVAAFCTSNTRGAAIKHYIIPAEDLSPAPPRRKNQHCLILDGPCRGQIKIITKCNVKNNTAEVHGLVPDLRFDQICLVAAWEKER